MQDILGHALQKQVHPLKLRGLFDTKTHQCIPSKAPAAWEAAAFGQAQSFVGHQTRCRCLSTGSSSGDTSSTLLLQDVDPWAGCMCGGYRGEDGSDDIWGRLVIGHRLTCTDCTLDILSFVWGARQKFRVVATCFCLIWSHERNPYSIYPSCYQNQGSLVMNHGALLSWVDDRDELISWLCRKPAPLIEQYGKSSTLMTHSSGKK